MAEFEGASSNPKDVKNSALSAASAASAGIASSAKYMKDKISSMSAMVASAVSSKNSVQSESGGLDSKERNLAIEENTKALQDLTAKITDTAIKFDVTGLSPKFFDSLLQLTSDSKKNNRLLIFARAFETAASIMGKAGSNSVAIDKLATSMSAAVQPLSSLAKSALLFSGGIALLGFTLITFMEAVTIEDIFKFALIMGVIALSAKLVEGAGWDVAKVTVGIALLGLTIWAWNELLTFEMSAQFVGSMLFVMGGLALASKISETIGGNVYANILKASLAVAAMGASVWIFSKAIGDADNVDLEKAAGLALAVVGFGFAFDVIGGMTANILLGSVAAVGIGAGLWVLTQGIREFSTIDMSLQRGLELAAIAVGTAGIFALIGNPLTIGFILAGAVAAGAIGLGMLALTAGMLAISSINISPQQAQNFKTSAALLTDAFVDFASPLKLPFLVLGMAQAALVAGSTFAMSGAIALVSKIPIAPPEKFENFKTGAIALSDVFADIGGPIRLLKITAGASVAMLVAGATLAIGTGIMLFTKIIADPSDVTKATSSLDLFIGGVETALVGREDAFPAIIKGINAFMGVSNLVQEIAASVQSIGNLEFVEKEVVNGKVVVKSIRKYTPEDFSRIGTSVGMILSALTEPLVAIGGSSDSISIGGFTITNPFSNKVAKGIEAVQGLSNVFIPIGALVNVFAKNNINEEFVTGFNKSLGMLLQGMTTEFMNIADVDEASFDNLAKGTKAVGSVIEKIVDKRFEKGVTNFERFAASMVTVKDSLNAMQLDKLAKFNELVFNIKASVESDAISDLVTVFKDFIDSNNDAKTSTSVATSEPIQTTNVFGFPTAQSPATAKKSQEKQTDDVKPAASSDDVVQAVEDTMTKLFSRNVMRVKIVN